jgi:hypothetical protein
MARRGAAVARAGPLYGDRLGCSSDFPAWSNDLNLTKVEYKKYIQMRLGTAVPPNTTSGDQAMDEQAWKTYVVMTEAYVFG